MNDLSQDVWFYTESGEKGGPVDFSTLQGMAKEGKLHPRLDLIWSKGMDRWQPAGEIQRVFESQPSVVAPRVGEAGKVSQERPITVVPPAKTSVLDSNASPGQGGQQRAKTEAGMPGARRRSYLFFLIVFPLLWGAVIAAVSSFTDGKMGQETTTLVASGLLVVPGLIALVLSFMRLVNLGMSGWWFLGNFVPLLNLWIGFRCFACPSGYAIYKKMDRVGIFLAILYWLLVLAGIVAFGAMVAIVFFHMGPPELREQIVDAIREGANLPAKP